MGANMSERIGIYMRVFRNEPEIHNAVKSVLDQTYNNWKFYIVVNEKTEPVLRPYAEADSRIQIIFEPADVYKGFIGHAKELAEDGNDYICTLDGDDTLLPGFMEQMLYFSKENQTDISFCGYYMYEPNQQVVARVVGNDFIWSIDQTNRLLAQMYCFFRTLWATFYSSEMILKCDFSLTPPSEVYGGYGGDTLFIFNCLYYCQKCGYHNVPLYNYYMNSASASHKMAPGRMNSDQVLYDFAKNFLIKKSIFGKTEDYILHYLYTFAAIDTVKLLLEVENDTISLYNALFSYLSTPLTTEALQLLPFYQTIPYLINVKHDQNIMLLHLIFCEKKVTKLPMKKQYAIYTLLSLDESQTLSFEEFSFLVAFPDLIAIYHSDNNNPLFKNLLKLMPYASIKNMEYIVIKLLKRISTNSIEEKLIISQKCIEANKEIYLHLHNKQYKEAIQLIQSKFFVTDFPDFSDELSQVWILCAATLEDGNSFILAKKVRTEFLATSGRIEEAKVELKEISEMGIEDEDTHYLTSLLT